MALHEPDDNTLDNAGPVGRDLADGLANKVVEAIDGFPAYGEVRAAAQRAAIARIVADQLYTYSDELEA
jgi:hypothetical protein